MLRIASRSTPPRARARRDDARTTPHRDAHRGSTRVDAPATRRRRDVSHTTRANDPAVSRADASPRRAHRARERSRARRRRVRAERAMSDFWLTIPRASRRADPTRPGRECVYYDVACAVQASAEGDRGARGAATGRLVTVERTTRRRYREFAALREDLDAECGRGRAPEPPPRLRFGRVNADDGRIEARRRALESWLWSVLADERCAKSEALRRFARVDAAERGARRASERAEARAEGEVDVSEVAGTPRRARSNGVTATAETLGAVCLHVETLSSPESSEASPYEPRRLAEVKEDSSALAVELEAAKEEARLLSEELVTTRECLKDARAVALAAQVKLEELETQSLKEKKVLSKEVRSLRRQLEEARLDENELANIISAEERAAALREVMREVNALRSRVQECTYEKLLSLEMNGPRGHSGGDPNELLAVSDNRLAVLLAETQIMINGGDDAQLSSMESPESAEAEQELLNAEREVRQTFADLLSDLINNRKSINSLLRKVARKTETSGSANDSRALASGIARVGNLVGNWAS